MSDSNAYTFQAGASGSEAVIFGQGDGTLTVTANGVDITNKANGGAITYLDGTVQGLQVTWATNFVLSNDASQSIIKDAAETGTLIEGAIMGIGGEKWTGSWRVEGRSDTATLNGGAAVMAVTFMSSGAPVRTPVSS